MLMDFILALGLLLTTASQLRPGSLPVGPGELLLVAWIGVTFVSEVMGGRPRPLGASKPLLLFWCVFTIAQMLGLMIGMSFEAFRDTRSVLHDTMAYSLMAGLCLLMLLRTDAVEHLKRVALIFVLLGGAVTLLLVVAGSTGRWLPLDFWYWSRFRGWSENPNQFALLSSVVVLIGVYSIGHTRSVALKAALGLAVAVSGFAGALTGSDSFTMFVLTALPVLFALKMWSALQAKGPRLSVATAMAGLVLFTLPGVAIVAAPAAPLIGAKVAHAIEKMMSDNDQAEDRFKLWSEAYEVGFNAYSIGFGPGPHLTGKQHKRPPPAKFEAHNTLLDLWVQSGFVAVLSFVMLLAAGFFQTVRRGEIALAALVLALTVFSLFHLTVRQPVFWFSICLCFAAAEASKRQAMAAAAVKG